MDQKNESIEIYQRYLFKEIIKGDPIIRQYMEDNINVSPTMITKLHTFYNSMKMKRVLLEIGKSVFKGVLINVKKVCVEAKETEGNKTLASRVVSCVRPILQFIEPENINIKLNDDENLALINDIVKKDKGKDNTNLYIMIGTNMLMSLVSANITDLLNDSPGGEGGVMTDKAVAQLYNKLMGSTAVDTDTDIASSQDIEALSSAIAEDLSSVIAEDPPSAIAEDLSSVIAEDLPSVIAEDLPSEEEDDTSSDLEDISWILDTVPTRNKRPREEDEEVEVTPKRVKFNDNVSVHVFDEDAILRPPSEGSVTPVDEPLTIDSIFDKIGHDGHDTHEEEPDEEFNTLPDKDTEVGDIVPNKKTTKITQMLEEFKQKASLRPSNNTPTNNVRVLPFE